MITAHVTERKLSESDHFAALDARVPESVVRSRCWSGSKLSSEALYCLRTMHAPESMMARGLLYSIPTAACRTSWGRDRNLTWSAEAALPCSISDGSDVRQTTRREGREHAVESAGSRIHSGFFCTATQRRLPSSSPCVGC